MKLLITCLRLAYLQMVFGFSCLAMSQPITPGRGIITDANGKPVGPLVTWNYPAFTGDGYVRALVRVQDRVVGLDFEPLLTLSNGEWKQHPTLLAFAKTNSDRVAFTGHACSGTAYLLNGYSAPGVFGSIQISDVTMRTPTGLLYIADNKWGFDGVPFTMVSELSYKGCTEHSPPLQTRGYPVIRIINIYDQFKGPFTIQ